MSERHLLEQYQARKDAEFNAFMATPAPSAENPKAAGGTEPLGPPAPPAPGAWAQLYQYLADRASEKVQGAKDLASDAARIVPGAAQAGVEGFSQIFESAAKNVTEGVKDLVTAPPTTVRGLGQKLSGVLQTGYGFLELSMVLPAAAGAAVQRAQFLSSKGATEETLVIPGGAMAGVIRTMRLP